MLALYLCALGFGGTTILASLLLGGGDKQLDKDLGHDVGGDNDHDGAADADHDATADADHDATADATADADHDATADGDADHDAAADHPADGAPHASGADRQLATGDMSFWWLFLSMRFWTFGMATFGLAGTLMTLLSVPDVATALSSSGLGLALGLGAARFFRALNTDQVTGDVELARYVGEEARVIVAVRPGQQGKIVLQTMAGRVEMLATTRDEAAIEPGSVVIVAQVRGGVADVSRLKSLESGADAARRRAREAARAATARDRAG